MNQQQSGFNILSFIKTISIAALITGAAILFFGCESNIEQIKAFSATENLPVLEAQNFQTVFTDSGQIRFSLKAPKLLIFEADGKDFKEFPEGMELVKYDANHQITSTLSANYAKEFIKDQKWEAKNNVIATNAQGDTLKTEHLIWDEKAEKIHTEEFVKIIRENQIITGIGFVSDPSIQILSAFFSGMEIAYVSANKLRLELDKQSEPFNSKILKLVTAKPGSYIAAMLVGNNIALVIYGIACAALLQPFLSFYIQSESLILFLQTLISTLVILAFAEFLPKTLFRIIPNTLLNFFSVPLALFYFLFYPITRFTVGITNLMMKVFFKVNLSENDESLVFSRIDLDEFVSERDKTRMEKKENVEPK